jgi:NADH-quinone oxidoreductase subunit G
LDFDPRHNQAHRYRPRDNMAVNKFWMCDEGMTSYRAAHDDRVTDARVKGKGASLGKANDAIAKALGDVPKESIAIVLSALHSLEDNWAMAELARLLGTKLVFFQQNPDGYADDILIHKDKNSNTAGVKIVWPDAKAYGDLARGIESGGIKHVISLGGPGEAVLDKLDALVAIAAHESPLTKAARVLLPATSWAEHSGTYVNAKGVKQVADKALSPQGDSLPAWEHAASVARALGLEPTWSSLKEIRQKLGTEHRRSEAVPTTDTQAV